MLRKRDQLEEAASLFKDIVKPTTQALGSRRCLAEQSDIPQQLKIAEQALRYVRQASFTEAEYLCRENGLEWVRQQDFWILFGDPITDTASMKGPYDIGE